MPSSEIVAERGAAIGSRVAALLRSGLLRTSAAFGVGAVAFAAANLLLAHQLAPEAYGTLALVVALIAIGSPIAPLGLSESVVRERLPVEPHLVLRCAATSALVAGVMTVTGAVVYDLTSAELAALAAAVLGGGCVRLAAAKLQSEERFVTSALVSESMNYILLGAAAAAFLLRLTDPLGLLALVAAAQLGLGAIWACLLGTRRERSSTPLPIRWSHALLLTGTNVAALLTIQIERLAIPVLLSIESLAAFAALAVFAIAPFRLFEVGIFRTLMPRLRNAPDAAARRRLFLREAAQAACTVLVLGLALLVMTPPLLALALGGKYHFAASAVLAAVVGGQLRVARSLLAAAISALADTRKLALWNGVSWLSLAAMFAGGAIGSAWELEGFLWGVVAGSIANIVLGVPLTLRCLRFE